MESPSWLAAAIKTNCESKPCLGHPERRVKFRYAKNSEELRESDCTGRMWLFLKQRHLFLNVRLCVKMKVTHLETHTAINSLSLSSQSLPSSMSCCSLASPCSSTIHSVYLKIKYNLVQNHNLQNAAFLPFSPTKNTPSQKNSGAKGPLT